MKHLFTISLVCLSALTGEATIRSWTNVWNQTSYFPGDTNLLYGTYTNVSNQITNSGTVGNPIVFLLQSNANFTAPYFDKDSGGIDPNNKSYIIIDGGINGYMRATNSGTGLGFRYGSGIIGKLDHSIIQNLCISNIYVRSSYTDNFLSFEGGNGINLLGNDITISNCTLTGMSGGITLQPNTATVNTNYNIFNCKLLNMNHCLTFSLPEDTVITNVYIAGNLFDHWDTWDGQGGNNNLHMDGLIFQDGASGGFIRTNAYYSNVCLYNNIIGSNYTANLDSITNIAGWSKVQPGASGYSIGTSYTNTQGLTASHGATAIIAQYLNGRASEFRNSFCFNNVALTLSNTIWGNAPISWAGSNVWMVNNTSVSINGTNVTCGGGMSIGGTNAYCFNNIGFPGYGVVISTVVTNDLLTPDKGTCVNRERALTNYMTGVWSDFNIWPDTDGANNFSWFFQLTINGGPKDLGQPIYYGLTLWQTFNNNNCSFIGSPIFPTTHCDPHSKEGAVLYGSFLVPTTNSIAALAGTNLTAVASTFGIPQLLTDYYGSNRPASGNWDIGAINSGAAALLPTYYTLSITNGTGSGSYTNTQVVNVGCSNASLFALWVTNGITAGQLSATNTCSPTFTMGATNATFGIIYTNAAAPSTNSSPIQTNSISVLNMYIIK